MSALIKCIAAREHIERIVCYHFLAMSCHVGSQFLPTLCTRSTLLKIRRIYGRVTGNQLPVHAPLFLREPEKNISQRRTGSGKVVSNMVA